MIRFRSRHVLILTAFVAAACGDDGTDLPDPGPGPEALSVEYVDGDLILDWEAVTDADSYNVYWDHEDSTTLGELEPDAGVPVVDGVSPPHTFDFPGVHSSESVTRYWFAVRAVVDGVVSEPSDVVSAGVYNGFVRATAGVEAVILLFQGGCSCGPDATMEIWWDTGEEPIASGDGTHLSIAYADTPFIHDGLMPDTTYQYAVVMTNEWGSTEVFNVSATPADSEAR